MKLGRPPTDTEQEILDLLAGIQETDPALRATRLLIEVMEKREHISAVMDRPPEGVTRDYLAGRNAALMHFRDRLEKLIKLANPAPDQA